MSFGETSREWLIHLAFLADMNHAKRVVVETNGGLTYTYENGTLTVEAAAGDGRHPATFPPLSLADLDDEKFAVVPELMIGADRG